MPGGEVDLQVLVGGALGALDRGLDLGLGLFAAGPGGALDRLPGLEVLVDGEEVLDLHEGHAADIVKVEEVGTTGVVSGDAQHLVVATHLVLHLEHGQCAALDEAAGEGGLREEDQGVQRIAVLAEGSLDVPVVVRVLGRGEQRTVKTDTTGLVVHLVLVFGAARNLDGHIKVQAIGLFSLEWVGEIVSHEGPLFLYWTR